jgi:hypothetical protein
MKKIIYSILTLFLLSGCTSEYATINDVAVRVEHNSGYRVTAINGEKEVRVKSRFVTMVPFVVVSPGKNTIEVTREAGADSNSSFPEKASFIATVEEGKRYRIQFIKGVFSLLEEPQK